MNWNGSDAQGSRESQIFVTVSVDSRDLRFQVWDSRSSLSPTWLTCSFYYCHRQEEMNYR